MSNQMTKEDAARIQSANAKSGNDPGFASRAQSAADKHQSSQASGSQGGNQSGGQGSSQSGQGHQRSSSGR
ncbi:hypothetical protein FQN54_002596 [Arachnomyces sp. PD_36]|nr:hypothetical protein FQN54_002596 [Arachnomyces sp. PD_36]